MKRTATIAVVAALAGCADADWNGSVEDLLESQPERFATVMDDPERHRVQIIYTQIDRDANNRPSFRSFTYRVAAEYFYPASTVKLPTAALALEKIHRLDIPGLDRDSVFLVDADKDFQTEAHLDPTSPTGLPSVAHYVRKLLVVSDNDAFNRLYEFLGQGPLNAAMHAKGYTGTRIIHRLESPLTTEQHRWTNPVRFLHAGSVVYQQGGAYNEESLVAAEPVLLGEAEIVDGERLARPKDFAEKNAYPLQDLHDTLRAILFPGSMPPERRFDLSDDDYRFLWRYMSEYPAESGIAAYADGSHYPDGYVKFLLYGGREPVIPETMRIFNKVGDAYGFLTDAAYVVDFDNAVEFMLAATVYTNANATFNDNEYEYDDIGFPFLANLGQAFYEVELARERTAVPDLSRFRNLR